MDIFARRWHVRVLAHLHDHNGARFVVMKHALGISADSLTRALKELMDLGWVQRNPGYGHPLRPEYILTDGGRVLAAHCSRFQALIGEMRIAGTIYRKWSVPSLVAIEGGADRFNELRAHLQITPRALAQSLSRLCEVGLVRQQDGYSTTERGSIVARRAMELML